MNVSGVGAVSVSVSAVCHGMVLETKFRFLLLPLLPPLAAPLPPPLAPPLVLLAQLPTLLLLPLSTPFILLAATAPPLPPFDFH